MLKNLKIQTVALCGIVTLTWALASWAGPGCCGAAKQAKADPAAAVTEVKAAPNPAACAAAVITCKDAEACKNVAVGEKCPCGKIKGGEGCNAAAAKCTGGAKEATAACPKAAACTGTEVKGCAVQALPVTPAAPAETK